VPPGQPRVFVRIIFGPFMIMRGGVDFSSGSRHHPIALSKARLIMLIDRTLH
jgi:hypothetical protein